MVVYNSCNISWLNLFKVSATSMVTADKRRGLPHHKQRTSLHVQLAMTNAKLAETAQHGIVKKEATPSISETGQSSTVNHLKEKKKQDFGHVACAVTRLAVLVTSCLGSWQGRAALGRHVLAETEGLWCMIFPLSFPLYC